MTIAWDRAILAAAILVACYLVAWAVQKLGADTAFRLILALFVLIAAAVFVAPRSDLRQSNDAPTGSVSARDPGVARQPSPAPSSFGGFPATGNRVGGQTGAPRPRTATPSPSAKPSHFNAVGPAATAGPRPASASSAPARTGLATWYCCTRGYSSSAMVAAAGPALRVGHWRGRWVTVRGNGRTIRVRLLDYCGCPRGRVIDLHRGAFARLAPLSKGIVGVKVTW